MVKPKFCGNLAIVFPCLMCLLCMLKPAHPSNEAERLAALKRYDLLDTAPEQAYDDLITILSGICNVPMSAVTLIDAERQWFKARVGLDVEETSRDVSFCGHVVMTPKELLVVEDAREDPRFFDNPLVLGGPKIRFYAGAPLVDGEGLAMGSLCVMDQKPRQMTEFQQAALRSLSRQVSMLMELHRSASELRHHIVERDWYEQQLATYQGLLETQNAELAVQSRVDPLTGLANRRAFNEALKIATDGVVEGGAPSALILFDIDHFKTVNDTLGHPVGDQVLEALAEIIQKMTPDQATAARVGGEEFALILPGSAAHNAFAWCQEIGRRIEANRLPTPVTVSLGLSHVSRDDTPETWYARTDAALYRAKHTGRNRVVWG
jgi:diguanylate cyclase (GGDEF)-like protein